MRHFPKAIAVIALFWAIAAPLQLMLANMRDEQARKLQALHSIANDNDKPLVKSLAEKEVERTDRFTFVALGSSVFIAVLASIVLFTPRKPK